MRGEKRKKYKKRLGPWNGKLDWVCRVTEAVKRPPNLSVLVFLLDLAVPVINQFTITIAKLPTVESTHKTFGAQTPF